MKSKTFKPADEKIIFPEPMPDLSRAVGSFGNRIMKDKSTRVREYSKWLERKQKWENDLENC